MLAQGGQSTDLVMLGEGGGREDPQVWCCSGRGVDKTHRSDAIQGGVEFFRVESRSSRGPDDIRGGVFKRKGRG